MADYSWMKPGVRAIVIVPKHRDPLNLSGKTVIISSIPFQDTDNKWGVTTEEKIAGSYLGFLCTDLRKIDDDDAPNWEEIASKTDWLKEEEKEKLKEIENTPF